MFLGDIPFSQNRNEVPSDCRKLVVVNEERKEKKTEATFSLLALFFLSPTAG